MPNLTWTHYRELLAVNEEKVRYEGEDGKGNLSKLIIEIFLTDCTDHTDFMLLTATGHSTKSCAKDSLYRTGVQEE